MLHEDTKHQGPSLSPPQTLRGHGDPAVDVGPVPAQSWVGRLPLRAGLLREGHEVAVLPHEPDLDVLQNLQAEYRKQNLYSL